MKNTILLFQNLSLRIVIVDTSKNINKILKNTKNPNLKYIHLPDNGGISFSRNLGIKEVDDEFILFMDDDFLLNSKSRLTKFKSELQELDYDVLGGEVNNIIISQS